MKTEQIPLTRGLLAAFGFGVAVVQCWAGDIVGVVSDSSHKGFLPGASVLLVENGRTESADSGGRFRFSNLAAGNYNLRVTYVGYEEKTQAVSVPASGEVPVLITMDSGVIVLEKVVVEGYREGRSRALQQKRNTTNIMDIISSDAIGNLPDRNVSEAVARLPGVTLMLDSPLGQGQGEGRYVSIRGFEPGLNQVLLDGATLAAPGGSRLGRAVPLDTLPAAQAAQIEVIKSATPDMDANALGGTVNIKTASPFDRKERFLAGSVGGNYNETTEKSTLLVDVAYSDLFGAEKKWGFSASANYNRRYYENHRLQSGFNLRTINGTDIWLPNTLELNTNSGNYERYSFNFSLEYRPDSNTQFYLRPNYSKGIQFFGSWETNVTVDNSPARVTLASPTTGVFAAAGVRTQRRQLLDRMDQELVSIIGGFKKVVGNFTIEPALSISTAQELKVFSRGWDFRSATGTTGPVNFDIGAFDFLRWEVDSALDSPNKYPLQRTRDQGYGPVDEDILTAKIDIRRESDKLFGHPGYLKAGFKYLQRKRLVDFTSLRLLPTAAFTQRLDTIGVLPAIPGYHGRYTTGFRVDADKADAFIKANPTLTIHDLVNEAANSIEDDYDLDEYIYAAYAMASVDINKLTLLGGVRWEKTDDAIRAVEARTAGGVLLGQFPTSGATSYDHLFPNLQAVYHFNKSLLLRGAITQTIGRPAYEDARPLSRFSYTSLGAAALNPAFPNTGTLNIGNPELSPFQATNYDLSLEWYSKRSGVISLALFRKVVDDPIYNFSEDQQNVVHSGISLEKLSVTGVRNATSAEITGVEFNLYQPFTFLPAPFDGFGIDANLTHISSSVKVPTRPGAKLPFFVQPSNIANITLFYEKGRFSGRVAWAYADEQLYTLGSVATVDIYRKPRQQYDAQFRYRINGNYSITAAVRNITREPEQFSYDISERMRTSRYIDRDYKLGVNFNY